jgi:putative intracellular protease/amidase
MHKSCHWLSGLFLVLIFLLISCSTEEEPGPEESITQKKILMFLSSEMTYYSEYIVVYEALTKSGYEVDVMSATTTDAGVYMLPSGTNIIETANSLPGSNHYNEFKKQFKGLFGHDWNENLNTIPASGSVAVDGKIQSVDNLDAYLGLVIVGGTGILAYRLDNAYQSQGDLSANQVEEVAIKLSALANEALLKGKPILAQCHGGSLPVFWKIQGTSTSLLAGELAAGYPEASTGVDYAAQGVTLRPDDKVVVASPNSALPDGGNGRFKIITSRDWYPQTVAHAARVFLNVIETYPSVTQRTSNVKVLILHGGAVNEVNCNASNRENDVPCNYGTGIDLPADFTHIKQLLQASHSDNYQFEVADLNITNANLPYSPSDQASVENYLNTFDVIVFFKHWSTGVDVNLQNAIVSFADNGGGVLGLHHAIYNDVDDQNPLLNKNILTTNLFGATSEESTWSGTRADYVLYSTNYGHFVSTFNIDVGANSVMPSPATWTLNPLMEQANQSLSVYHTIPIFDEVYNNKIFFQGQQFGYDINEITPIFSNDISGQQAHTEGFVRLFNNNSDSKIGKVAFFQPGENRGNFSTEKAYGQVVRNAVVWLAH